MDLYPYALLLHIAGAIGLFVGLGLQWVAVARLRQAVTRAQLIAWMGVMTTPRLLAPVSMLVILVTGLYMVATQWSLGSWAGAGLVGLVVLGAIGGLAVGRTMMAIGRMLPTESEVLSPALRKRLAAPTLTVALWLETGLALAIVAVMVLKPDFATSLVVLIAGSVIGAGAGLLAGQGGVARAEAPEEADDTVGGASGAV